MKLKDVFFVIVILVGLSQLEEVLAESNIEPPCRDDPFFQFGTFQWNGKTYTRTCAWLTENANLIDKRKEDWCDQTIGNYFVVHEKCPETCGKCVDRSNPNCSMDYPIGWHDSTGEEYNCNWYAGGENCNMWGNSFPKYGRTANQACCACGGGCTNMPLLFRDSLGRDCEWYAAKPSRCEEHGYRYRNNGYVANEACCACDGGSAPGND